MKKGRKELWIETGGSCRDCGIRGALAIDGLPRRHKWYGFRLSSRCDGCGGNGRASVRVENLEALVHTLSRRRKRPLTAKQLFVIGLRYGLKDGNSYTQREVAGMMGVSQEAVRKHEEAAKKKIESIVSRTTKSKEVV